METLDPAYAESRPALTEDDAARIAAAHWGLAGEARELPSERDRVFEIRTLARDGSRGDRAILKIANWREKAAVLEFQHRMLGRLAAAGLPYAFPTLHRASSGADLISIDVAGCSHAARLLSYVEGVPLGEIRGRPPRLDRDLGRLVGSIDRELLGLDSPGADRELAWDLRAAPALVADSLDAVDEGRREMLRDCLAAFERTVAPRAADLRVSIIHNDANDANLRVDPGSPTAPPRILGLVDFGDAVRSWTIADLAVACAYAGFDRPDPVGAFGEIARGYAAELPVDEAESDVLFELIRLRLALSVVVSAVRASQEPSNAYLEVSRAPAWRLLDTLVGTSPDLAQYRLREALGHEPCPATARVAAALAAAAGDAAPILEPDPRHAATLTIDLSVEGGDDAGTFDPTDHTAFTRVIFDRMRDAGAAIGIGRYDEVRWWYTTDEFVTPGNDRDEWRSVHLGIDLFAEAGARVTSPLAGRVLSVHDNADRLDYGPTVIVEHELPAGAAAPADPGPVRFWALYGHLSPETLDHVEPGDELAPGDTVGWLGAPPRNGDWAPHLHFQVVADLLDYEGTFPGVAAPSQRAVWLAVSPDPNLLLGIPAQTTAPRPRPPDHLRADRAARLGPSLSLSYRRPLHIVRGRGARLYDADGQPYLDCVNNVAHVGHSHPRVTHAASRQLGILNTNTRYLHEEILRYTERLLARFPEPLSVCFLVCSGTEATELALRMARTHTGKTGAVVVDGAYHGNSASVINLSPYKFNGPGGKGVRPWVRVVPMPDVYRGLYRDEPDPGPRYAAHVAEAIASLDSAEGLFGAPRMGAAAFFCESLLSCGGQIPLPAGYLAGAYAAARDAGAVCVADEVQVGFGRVGDHFWGFEEHGVVPDIVTLGKPMGNGHPLAAVVTTRAIAASFDNGMEYFNTFGGNPVSCAIGQAVLDVIEEEGLQARAADVGGWLLRELAGLRDRHPMIGDVRGRGLFLGIELVEDRETRAPAAAVAAKVVNRARDRGVLLSTDGPDHNVIKIKPPLVFSKDDAALLVDRIDDALSETWATRSSSI